MNLKKAFRGIGDGLLARRELDLEKTVLKVGLILSTIIVLFPFFVMLSFSLRARDQVFDTVLLPANPTLINYIKILNNNLLMKNFLNSLILATSVALAAIIISVFTGYGLSRYDFWGKRSLLYILFGTQMLPPILVAAGFFETIVQINLYDSILSLIIVDSVRTVPFAVWMMKGYFDGISESLDEMGMVDGCSRIGACFRIVVPVTTPGMIAVGIWAFVYAWNEYLVALTFITSQSKQMITTAVVSFQGHFIVQWGLITAYSIIVSLPVVILFVYFQQYFISGMTGGAIKG